MDNKIVERLKKMSKEEIGLIKVGDIAPIDAIWALVEYIKELEGRKDAR